MNVEPMIAATAGWLLTVALHGGLFLLAAWLIDRTWHAPPNAWRELMWRVALFGGEVVAEVGGVTRRQADGGDILRAQRIHGDPALVIRPLQCRLALRSTRGTSPA